MLHVADGLLPLLEALAAASTAETSRTAGLDVQMIATAADDVLADAQAAARLADVQAAARLAAGGGALLSVLAFRPSALQRATRPRRRRRDSGAASSPWRSAPQSIAKRRGAARCLMLW